MLQTVQVLRPFSYSNQHFPCGTLRIIECRKKLVLLLKTMHSLELPFQDSRLSLPLSYVTAQ